MSNDVQLLLNGRHARRWGAAPNEDTVLAIHGLISHSAWFSDLGESLARLGGTLVCADRRGAGLNATNRGDWQETFGIVEDELRVAEALRLTFARIHLVGWCGAAWHAVALAARRPDLFRSVTLVAPLCPGAYTDLLCDSLEDFARRSKRVSEETPVDIPPYAHGLLGDRMSGVIDDDPLLLRRITPRLATIFLADTADAHAGLSRLTLPVQAIVAREDRLILPDRAISVLRAHLPEEAVVTVDGPHACWHGNGDNLAGILSAFVNDTRSWHDRRVTT